eukprot:6213561-Pleurochrysis_carterae.AAC.1
MPYATRVYRKLSAMHMQTIQTLPASQHRIAQSFESVSSKGWMFLRRVARSPIYLYQGVALSLRRRANGNRPEVYPEVCGLCLRGHRCIGGGQRDEPRLLR